MAHCAHGDCPTTTVNRNGVLICECTCTSCRNAPIAQLAELYSLPRQSNSAPDHKKSEVHHRKKPQQCPECQRLCPWYQDCCQECGHIFWNAAVDSLLFAIALAGIGFVGVFLSSFQGVWHYVSLVVLMISGSIGGPIVRRLVLARAVRKEWRR